MTAAERFVKRMLGGITSSQYMGNGSGGSIPEQEDLAKHDKHYNPDGLAAELDGVDDEDGEGEVSSTESAIDAAIAYLESEGDEPTRRNVFAKDWAFKKSDRRGKTSKTAQDELYEALVEDAETLTDKTLAEHDKERHPNGYHEGDTCKFREKMMVETEADKADEVDADKVGRETTWTAEQPIQAENKRESFPVDKPQAKVYDGISKKKVEKYKGQMAKKHPELDADLILTELAKIKDPKLQGDAFAWVMKGAIKLPEDMYKVEQARELATKAKRDPLQWDTPQACIDELLGEGHRVKEKPITVGELKTNPLMSDYRDEGYGVETFQVEDSQKGMELIRGIINSHLGTDRNPWCLSKADENGNLIDEASYWWTEYDQIPKRVAFKDGKLIAFSASTQPFRGYNVSEVLQKYPQLELDYARDVEEGRYDDDISYWLRKYHSEKFNRDPKDEDTEGRPWYNLWDEKHEGIPLGVKEVPNDKLGRKAQCELRGGEIVVPKGQSWFVGTPGQPGYKKWWTSASKGEGDNLEEEITEEGTIITYGRDGKTVEKKYRPGVGKIRYYKDGSVSEEYNDKDELVVSFYEDGKKSYQRFVDGGYVFYDEEGNIELDKRKSRKAKEMERPVFDELVIALIGEKYVEDADTLPKGETLEEHDRKRHKGHFDPSTQTCKFREEMKKETDSDRADEISPESAPKAEGGEEGGQKKPLVSPEEDKAYMEAVERGDMETAAKMVREVAARTFPNTKVIDKDGKPSIVFHGTEADFTEFDPSTISRESGNFGYFGKGFYFAGREDLGDYYAFIRQGKRMNEFVDIQNPFVYNDETIAKIAKEIGLDNDLEKDWSLLEQPSHFSNQESVEKFTEAIKGLGYDGVLVYDRAGLGELVAFKPNQIKSADPVTYDDDGNVIPLSRRFDDGDDIRGDVSSGTKSGEFGEDFFSSVYPDRTQSYSSEFGTDEEEEKESAEEAYKANFTKDGKYKPPFEDGRFSKEILEKAREEQEPNYNHSSKKILKDEYDTSRVGLVTPMSEGEYPEELKFLENFDSFMPSLKELDKFVKDAAPVRAKIQTGRDTLEEKESQEIDGGGLRDIVDSFNNDSAELALLGLGLLGMDKEIPNATINMKWEHDAGVGFNEDVCDKFESIAKRLPCANGIGKCLMYLSNHREARASSKGQAMMVRALGDFREWIHELGHVLCMNKEVQKKCLAFLEYRTKSDKNYENITSGDSTIEKGPYAGKKRNEIPPTINNYFMYGLEIAKADRFWSKYCGKSYLKALYKGKGTKKFVPYNADAVQKIGEDNVDTYSWTYSTEIMAMGLERLLYEPDRFIDQDSEYAAFVIGVLKGV